LSREDSPRIPILQLSQNQQGSETPKRESSHLGDWVTARTPGATACTQVYPQDFWEYSFGKSETDLSSVGDPTLDISSARDHPPGRQINRRRLGGTAYHLKSGDCWEDDNLDEVRRLSQLRQSKGEDWEEDSTLYKLYHPLSDKESCSIKELHGVPPELRRKFKQIFKAAQNLNERQFDSWAHISMSMASHLRQS